MENTPFLVVCWFISRKKNNVDSAVICVQLRGETEQAFEISAYDITPGNPNNPSI